MFYILFMLFVSFVLGMYFLLKYKLKLDKDKFDRAMDKILKCSSVVYCVVSLISILFPNALNLSYSESEIESLNLGGLAFVKWLSQLAFIMIPLAVFFKNRIIRNIAIYVCPIVALIQVACYPGLLEMFTSTSGRGVNSLAIASENLKDFMINPVFRSVVFGLIIGMEIIIPVVLAFQEKHVFKIKSSKEWLLTGSVLVASLVSCVPISVPQHLFGYTSVIFDAWTLPHLLWIAFVVIEVFALYFIFRKRDYETKMIMLFVLSLSLILQYNQMFGAISINIERLPLQLCNVGSYLVLIFLITKSKKLFDFAVIVNVVGVLFALAMPDLDGEGVFYLYNVHFMLEHTNVLVVPILALLLKIFDRLDAKSFKHFFLGFLIYFAGVFVLGTIFNGVAKTTGNSFWEANYLFMFDQKTAEGFIPFLGKLFDVNFSVGALTFYPLMLCTVYVVFNVICLVVFFSIQGIYLLKRKLA